MPALIPYTTDQAAAALGWRANFDRKQAAMASEYGFDQYGQGDGITGNASTVPVDAWRRIDARGQAIQRAVLAVFSRLAAASTTHVDPGDIVSYYAKVSNSGEATISMDGRSSARADVATIQLDGTPVPLIESPVRMGWRAMEVNRKGSVKIDQVSIDNAQRVVAEALEAMALNGSAIQVSGAKVYGLRTLPQRYTTTHGVALASATGAQWMTAVGGAVKNMVTQQNAYGQCVVFLNYADWIYAGQTEFAAGYPKTILQRLLEIPNVSEIVPVPTLPASEIIALSGVDTGEWGTVLSAMPLTVQPLVRQNQQDDYVWNVIAMQVPQFRADANGKSRIVHLTQT